MSESTMTTTEYRYKVCRPDGYGLTKHTNEDGSKWIEGRVRTPQGYVSAYSQEGLTSVSIIHQGLDVTRTIRRTYTARGLVTLADRFAREVCQ